MNSLHDVESGAVAFGTEFRKLAAFLRRDVRTAWSYRGAFFADWANILLQVAIFYFVSKIVSKQNIEQYSPGHETSYIEFVAIGIAFGAFVQSSLSHVVVTIRQEQLMGTLESLLVTPTTTTTLQLGSFVYDLIYVPVRTTVYLMLMVLVFGINLQVGGLLPTMVILVRVHPFRVGTGLDQRRGDSHHAARHGRGRDCRYGIDPPFGRVFSAHGVSRMVAFDCATQPTHSLHRELSSGAARRRRMVSHLGSAGRADPARVRDHCHRRLRFSPRNQA